MKKTIALITLCVILMCGCQNSAAHKVKLTTELYKAALEEFEYPIEDPFIFSADDSGGIVCVNQIGDTVRRYSADGELTAEFPVPEGIYVRSVACDENRVVILGANADRELVIGEIDGGGVKELYVSGSDIQNNRLFVVLSEDKIYFSAVGAEPEYIDYPNGSYRHNGLMLYSLDIAGGKCEEICKIVTFAKDQNGVMLYCCDEGGFYFVGYDGGFGEKYYSGLEDLYAFCPIGENAIAYPGGDNIIKAALLYGEANVALADANSYGAQPMVLSAGTIIYNSIDVFGEHIVLKRIDPQDYIKNLNPVNLIMIGEYGDKTVARGYAAVKRFISEEEIVLKLLSGDTDWDAAVVYSRTAFASQVASQGVFQPLDVQEYIDAYYPSAAEVCKTEEGEIWAIPIDTAISCIIYNEETCGEFGLDFSKMTTEEFLSKSRELCEDPELKGTWVDLNWSYIAETILNDCVYNFDPDSEQFRSIMEALKKDANVALYPEYMQNTVVGSTTDGFIIYQPNNAYSEEPDKFLFTNTIGYGDVMFLLGLYPDFSVAKMPFDGTNTGYTLLMIVNPYSENLEETLEFVSDLAKDKLEEIRGYSETDLKGRVQLDEIYADSKIIMGLPDEIYLDDFDAYLGEEMTLDEFAAEVKRKMAVYLNE